MKVTTVLIISLLGGLYPLFASVPTILFLVGGLLLLNCHKKKSIAPLKIYVIWVILFSVPLFIIHAFINPEFEKTTQLIGKVWIREGGVNFAESRIMLISFMFAIALCWINVNRENLIAFLTKVRLPKLILEIAFQSISLVELVQVRSKSILLAQKARGIRTEGNPIIRVKALVAIVVPLVISLLKEAPYRSAIQYYSKSTKSLSHVKGGAMYSIPELAFVFAIFALVAVVGQIAL